MKFSAQITIRWPVETLRAINKELLNTRKILIDAQC